MHFPQRCYFTSSDYSDFDHWSTQNTLLWQRHIGPFCRKKGMLKNQDFIHSYLGFKDSGVLATRAILGQLPISCLKMQRSSNSFSSSQSRITFRCTVGEIAVRQ